jgi:1-aminocyclopropane-1-carboxylate deaminase
VLQYSPTPIQEVNNNALDRAGVRLIVKREDLNHPLISGNKWWKLKYNIQHASSTSHKTILTFGGAFSNHIYATAAAAAEEGLQCIGIIRGEETLPLNPTLRFATDQGMLIQYVSRERYRSKHEESFQEELHQRFGAFYMIPEGGTNLLAVKGTAEFAAKELKNIQFDHLCLPVGTGGTMAGLIVGLEGTREIIGVSVLKNGAFLNDEIAQLMEKYNQSVYGNWRLLTSYDHGGYARVNRALIDFIAMMKITHDLPLDPLYTGKLLWAVMKEVENGTFKRGSTVLALHTGGLQGSSTILNRYEQ